MVRLHKTYRHAFVHNELPNAAHRPTAAARRGAGQQHIALHTRPHRPPLPALPRSTCAQRPAGLSRVLRRACRTQQAG